jgi:hypothetical protein
MSDVTSVQEQIKQAWQKVPTGERRELATRANLKGAQACLLAVLFAGTLAFCFKEPTVLLALLAFIPVFYQVVATREWLEGKPRIAITYFVAEKTATQYARHYRVSDYSVRLLFKGTLSAPVPEPLDPAPPGYTPKKPSVWVALFYDRLLMFSEHPEGARLEFSQALSEGLSAFSDASEDPDVIPESLYLETTTEADAQPQRWTLQSAHGETLVACERKIRLYGEQIRAEQARRTAELAEKVRLEQARLELLRQEQLRIEEERRAQEIAGRQQLIEELSSAVSSSPPPAPTLEAPAP